MTAKLSPRSLYFVAVIFAGSLCLIPIAVLARPEINADGIQVGKLEKIWSQHGITEGSLQKPRAMAIDRQGDIYIVDKTARIQVFDRHGTFLRGWRTPLFENGKPTGLSFDLDGNLLVADTHYFRVLSYTPAGKLLEDRILGGTFGRKPGEFGLVTEAVMDSTGCLYVSEYGEYDRIQKFSAQGDFLFEWGGHGPELGQFIRPQNMIVDKQDRIWVVDACNHRIQVFDATGDSAELVKVIGQPGIAPGEFRYPYDLLIADDYLYVCEFGNHRVQKLTLDGECIGMWGQKGRGEGELFNPWAIVQDERGRIHVLDTYNHRVQRIRL